MCRARSSGGQPLPAPSSPCSQDPASRGRLHAGAKAVLLGTMALLGLVRLLHPGGPAILSIRPRGRSLRLPLEARKRARCPAGHMARRRPADDRSAPEWVSNVHDVACEARVGATDGGADRAPMVGVRTVGDGLGGASHGYSWGVCANRLATPSWPVLSSAGPRRRRRSRETPAASWRGAGSGSSGLVGWMSIGRSIATRHDRDPGRRYSSTVNPERRSYRTNGRQAGLASCPG